MAAQEQTEEEEEEEEAENRGKHVINYTGGAFEHQKSKRIKMDLQKNRM